MHYCGQEKNYTEEQRTSSQVLQDGGGVDSSGGTNTTVGGGAALQQTVNTTDGELEACKEEIKKCEHVRIWSRMETHNIWNEEKHTGTSGTRDGLLFVTSTLDADGALGTLAGQALCTFSSHDFCKRMVLGDDERGVRAKCDESVATADLTINCVFPQTDRFCRGNARK